jgi:hypothetical protein
VPEEPSETDGNGILRRRWLRDGLRLRIDREDAVPSWARLGGRAPYEVRLGTAVVEVEVPPYAGCVLDGVAYGGQEGKIVLRGVAKGPHTLVVGAEGRRSVAHRIVLREGETRRIRPALRDVLRVEGVLEGVGEDVEGED